MAGFTRFIGFTVDWTTKATKIAGQATNFKTWLNTRTAELLDWLEDTFLAELESTTDSSSGADKVGMTKLTNYGSAAAATAQAQVEALDTALKANADADAAHVAETVSCVTSVTRDISLTGDWTITLPTTLAVAPKFITADAFLGKKASVGKSDVSTHRCLVWYEDGLTKTYSSNFINMTETAGNAVRYAVSSVTTSTIVLTRTETGTPPTGTMTVNIGALTH